MRAASHSKRRRRLHSRRNAHVVVLGAMRLHSSPRTRSFARLDGEDGRSVFLACHACHGRVIGSSRRSGVLGAPIPEIGRGTFGAKGGPNALTPVSTRCTDSDDGRRLSVPWAQMQKERSGSVVRGGRAKVHAIFKELPVAPCSSQQELQSRARAMGRWPVARPAVPARLAGSGSSA